MAKAIVITPTTGTVDLIDAINSVREQTIDVDHLVVCDGEAYREGTEWVINKVGEGSGTQVCYIPYNTGGGGFYGHRIMAAFSHLINHDYILFLDQDNWYEPDHVETLIKTIEENNYDWSYSLRKIFDTEKNYVADDNCESLGRWPVWVNEKAFLIDSSSYCFKTSFIRKYGHTWDHGWGADRRFYTIIKEHLKHDKYGTNGKHSLCYRLGGNPNSVQAEFFTEGNKKTLRDYDGKLPWLNLSS
jgi:glycosyltransferase involved in cell wall biosynthesis